MLSSGRVQTQLQSQEPIQTDAPLPLGRSKGSCPGDIIDHVKALACGGADHPSNMQWQTKSAAKAKDKWERKGC